MKILFCGGGALGSHGMFLARDLEHELVVIDFDRVESKNLASQWFVKQMVGKNKATALKTQLLNFYDVKLQDYTVKLTALNAGAILGPADLVVECFVSKCSGTNRLSTFWETTSTTTRITRLAQPECLPTRVGIPPSRTQVSIPPW